MSKKQSPKQPSGWEPVADWYDGWMGKHGSDHHRHLAIPTVLDLLQPQKGQHVLDIGAGQGVLAPHVIQHGAAYTGIDISQRLIKMARNHHRKLPNAPPSRFLVGDARRLSNAVGIEPISFDAVVFLLSIQDMNPLEDVVASARWALRDSGRLVILMTHPCFRIPRQSGWGYDDGRKLQYRRVDHYLSPLTIPMKSYAHGRGKTISFHRPLSAYINTLSDNGLLIDGLREVTSYKISPDKAVRRADQEIPLFLALRARKLPDESLDESPQS